MTIDGLEFVHSWKLERISPATFPQDIMIHLNLPDDERLAVASLIRGGCCYRCRISKGRYHFGATAEAAVKAALMAWRAREKAPKAKTKTDAKDRSAHRHEPARSSPKSHVPGARARQAKQRARRGTSGRM